MLSSREGGEEEARKRERGRDGVVVCSMGDVWEGKRSSSSCRGHLLVDPCG